MKAGLWAELEETDIKPRIPFLVLRCIGFSQADYAVWQSAKLAKVAKPASRLAAMPGSRQQEQSNKSPVPSSLSNVTEESEKYVQT